MTDTIESVAGEEWNGPCPCDADFPDDENIPLACDRCPELIIVCPQHGGCGIAHGDYSDLVAENAKLAAEVESLRCCGNCEHIELEHDAGGDFEPCDYRLECDTYFPGDDAPRDNDWPSRGRGWGVVDFGDHCHFTPSRWSRRGG